MLKFFHAFRSVKTSDVSHRLEGEAGIQRGNHCNWRRIMERGRDVKRKFKPHSIFKTPLLFCTKACEVQEELACLKTTFV